MKNTTATAIEQQSLSQDSANNLIENSFKALFKNLNDIEFDLESILVKEFAQGLPNDLDNVGL